MEMFILNRIGLLLGLLGVIIIFIWGPPQPVFEKGASINLEDNTVLENGKTVKEYNAAKRKKEKLHKIMSRIGLGFIFFGFSCQLLATFEC